MKIKLLPYRYKYTGFLLATTGTVMGILYLVTNFRIYSPVFAIFSWYMEPKMWVVFRTNISDDLIILMLLAGFALLAFSRERVERRQWMALRYRAFYRALVINTLCLLFSVLFVFGTGFLFILVLNVFSVFVFYLVIFYYLKWKSRIGGSRN